MNDTLPTPAQLDEMTDDWTVMELEPAAEAVSRPVRLGLLRRIGSGIASASEWLFGAFALFLGLSVLSAVPIFQFLSFGYLLESGGRVARSGRLRDALVGFRKAARVGRIVIGCWVLLLPLRFVSSLATSAQIIDPGGSIARTWRLLLLVLTVLTALHLVAACARGARVWHFLWPFSHPFWLYRRIRQGGIYSASRDAVWEFVASLHLPHYFRVGALGFIGTMAWLFLPVSLLAMGRRFPIL